MPLLDIASEQDFNQKIAQQPCSVIHFWADWCTPCTMMDQFLLELESQINNEKVQFLRVEAENVSEVTEKYAIESVPAFVFLSQHGKTQIAKVEGASPQVVAQHVNRLAALAKEATKENVSVVQQQKSAIDFKSLVNQSPVMLFMKGSPSSPKCGFSNKMVQLLNEQKVTFGHFDILSDHEVREGLKTYSNWPTYPQLYSKGQLIGGLDVVKELIESGDFLEELDIDPINQLPLEEKLKQLINQSPVMLFMKGSPSAPKCGFSNKIVQLLNEQKVAFGHFDILSDNDVREGLKTYSNWPTFPQLYSKGQLIGGLDVVKELIESDEFLESLE